LVEDVTIMRPYVGLSFRRASNGATARRVIVTDYWEDAFDAGGDADEFSGGRIRGVAFIDVVARDAPNAARDGNAFEIEDGAEDVVVRNALVENVSGNGAGLRNHVHQGVEAHSRNIEFSDVIIRRIGGPYSIFVRAAPGAESFNTFANVRLVNLSAEAPAAFWGPVRGLELSRGNYGEILLGLEDSAASPRADHGVPGAVLRDLKAGTLRINGACHRTTLRNVDTRLTMILP
jgi:hypothetical protein